ncbi:MAG: monovalent cation/H+ antiporter subunit A [Gammaproteobacteria bacterium]|nr:monovalent cation/H+ antiporter subunit A [Gammaproteobacteria bacterium]MBU4282357.1 monovalent cation/H+ antiporter subunit A [Gammaproteobacteria bacterium]MBU4324487.1 monovalent cation/H+ antiporter subunit A [Gammaproteobacteria bacterium]MBU4505427.1 monovalent cation/H+ antiporter subunit A [Gammaproteobacteria bacterium]PKO77029.1 MAG: monovalent cation/H+ antiporter subunit A [Betaproteobacteria bacterium HGW-Betaproteobacteria-15]
MAVLCALIGHVLGRCSDTPEKLPTSEFALPQSADGGLRGGRAREPSRIANLLERRAVLLLIVLLPLLLGTAATFWLGSKSRLLTACAAGAVTAASLALLLSHAPAVMAGETVRNVWAWVPEIGLALTFRLDGLSLLFAGLILFIGLLIVLYAHFYLSPKDSPGKFYSEMMLFMAAMLGVALSDNLLLLVVFWELTSLSSFLLIGFWSHRADARAGARQALAVTGGGGLAMLGGFVLLGQIAGTYELSEMLGSVAMIQADPLFVPALLLILLGAFTKSAQFPFHFWLPDAMAAPTPVSAYLHSATMVKAGVFLLMRMYPVLAGSGWFEVIVTATGLATVLFAAFIALFKHDLKGLLAYSTVSHLGLIVFLVGLGSPLAAVAAVFHVLNHATFKASLFMIAGIVDHETHSRDMRQLGGLWKFMPWTATLSMVAAASMAGVPLTNGFLSKEMFFTEAVVGTSGLWGWVVPALVTLAGVFSVAYSLRFVHDTYFNGELGDVPNTHPHEPPLGMKLPAMLLVTMCIVVGLLPAITFGPLVHVAATALAGQPLPDYHLAIWHGFNLPLLMSAIALAAGAGLYFLLASGKRMHRIESETWFGPATGRQIFEGLIDGLFALAGRISIRLETGSLQLYLVWLMGAAVVVASSQLVGQGIGAGSRELLPASPLAIAVWLLLAATCLALVFTHRQRFQSVVLVGVVGLVTSLTFVSLSAPDLALTQLSVEVVSTVLLLMGLALLPQYSPRESTALRRTRDGVMALAGGAGVAWVAWVLLTRNHDSISWYFLEKSLPVGGGTNVVNVILVDFRGYDTFGEITVLGIAAIGVLALMDGMRTRRPLTDPQGLPWTFAAQPLLLRVAASVVLPLALVFTLYIFMRGHNLPGGGFIAGLITAVALVLQFMALGQANAEAMLRAQSGRRFVRWIGAGLSIAGLTGAGAFFWSRPFMTSAHGHPHVPLLGELPLASAALFDLGVYLTVVGSTLLTISVLGSVSREGEPSSTLTATAGGQS